MTEYDTIVHKGEMQMPSVMFMYDMSPISVTIKEIRSSFTHLLVRFCAVVGGVFAVTGTLRSLVLAIFLVTACQVFYCVRIVHSVQQSGNSMSSSSYMTEHGSHCIFLAVDNCCPVPQVVLRSMVRCWSSELFGVLAGMLDRWVHKVVTSVVKA